MFPVAEDVKIACFRPNKNTACAKIEKYRMLPVKEAFQMKAPIHIKTKKMVYSDWFQAWF